MHILITSRDSLSFIYYWDSSNLRAYLNQNELPKTFHYSANLTQTETHTDTRTKHFSSVSDIFKSLSELNIGIRKVS